MDQEDCVIEVVATPTQKKLKQARLPFQSLSSSEASDTVANKKRKLTSPSPTNRKSEKIARKENVIKATDDVVVESKKEKSEDQQVLDDESSDLSKKSDGRVLSKPNALTRFLQKGSVSTVNIKPQDSGTHELVVMLDKCDEKIDRQESNPITNDDSTNSLNSNKEKYELNLNDSINEKSAKQEEVISDNSAVECIDISAMNSDVESEISSSEDDDNDDDKKSNDDTDDVEQKTDNNLENTPTSNKNTLKVEVKKRKLTPRQLEKKMESQKKQEERQKLKAEREKQRMEKKMKWQQEKEAEREQKRKEKEYKELKKQMEIEQKQKEKERKEEDRRKREEAKEEEKRKKEEERLELERKKQKAASTFVSFFVPKKLETKAAVEEKVIGACNFMPFEIKADMKVAPTCRRSLSNAEKLAMDTVCFNNTVPPSKLYLNEIKNDKSNIHRSGKTWSAEAKDDVVVLDEDDVDTANIVDQTSIAMEKHHPKLFYFAENRRPPYWGTWRKKSTKINPRRPFNKDEKWFDYEIDSDEEWEEEEPGESLRGSDDEKDEENPDDDEYDVDNEFMVPHGYLSDEEARADGEDGENMSPETQKFKLKILGEQFEAEMNEKTAKIKPKIIGCIWQGPLNSYPENTPPGVLKFLSARQAWVAETPIILASSAEVDVSSNNDIPSASKKQSTFGKKKTKVPEEALPELIRLIHGNPHGRLFLIKEFITYWNRKYPDEKQHLSKISVAQKIRDLAKRIACPEEGPMHLRTCWYVSEETRKKYLDEDLTLPNKWSYSLTPNRKMSLEAVDLVEKIEKEKESDRDKDKEQKDKEKEKKYVPLITQFTKKITQEEMKKQLSVKSSSSPSSNMILEKPRKRATLISVARGEQFPKASSIVNAFSKVSDVSKDNVINLPGTSDNIPIIIDDSSQSPSKRDISKESHHTKDNEKP
ncbi:hypothetical protein PV327_003946 [Microctonus hyperodae]|uniref:Chromatin assembly factor 1 subunit A n=1 Tax=Microctonus hyperodae TaxID=165561 RepID=A0AA39G606_MICHY|nr:hypothetical protein PV327_003946 [Microctonus hyperodae]